MYAIPATYEKVKVLDLYFNCHLLFIFSILAQLKNLVNNFLKRMLQHFWLFSCSNRYKLAVNCN